MKRSPVDLEGNEMRTLPQMSYPGVSMIIPAASDVPFSGTLINSHSI